MKGRVMVIGSPVIDEVHTYSGRTYRSFGGIAYTIAAASLLLPEYEIFPVVLVGNEEREEFLKFIDGLPNVSPELLMFEDGVTNRNRLIYRDEQERDEFFELRTKPIPFSAVKPHLDGMDAIIVNFITPIDIELETMKSISMAYKGLLYGDIHSLLRRVSENGRFELLRSLPDWNRWASFFDVLQMNHMELPAFTGFDIREPVEFRMASAIVLSAGPRCLNVTFGKKGSLLAYREGGEVLFREFSNPEHEPIDPTGCGDVFGAAFVAALLSGKSCPEAAEFANLKAMEKATGRLKLNMPEL